MGGKSVGYLQSVALERDLNLGPPDYTSGAPNHYATPPLTKINKFPLIKNFPLSSSGSSISASRPGYEAEEATVNCIF